MLYQNKTRYKNKQDIKKWHCHCIKTANTITDAVRGPGLDAGLDKLDEIFWAPVRKFEYGLVDEVKFY